MTFSVTRSVPFTVKDRKVPSPLLLLWLYIKMTFVSWRYRWVKVKKDWFQR